MENHWYNVLRECGLKDCDLLYVSDIDIGRRTYVFKGRLLKLLSKKHNRTGSLRISSLYDEYEILRSIKSIKGVPQNPSYFETSSVECLSYDFIDGKRLNELALNINKKYYVITKLIIIIFSLSLKGLAHRDIKLENIIVGNSGVYIIDFDQAVHTGFWKSLGMNFFGISSDGCNVFGSYLDILRYFDILRPFLWINGCLVKIKEKINKIANRLGVRSVAGGIVTVPCVDRNNRKLNKIRNAWMMAQNSNASSPGTPICYYELFEGGYCFPGERPWSQRWEVLKCATDYNNKKVLELGCNLGLLSCFLLKEKDVRSAVCVDADSQIIAAAQLISDAYDVSPFYKRVDFDSTHVWENELIEFGPDIVFALNVLNWVKDKNRFLDFLSNFNEVIFEGHDNISTEIERFIVRGFNYSLLGVTERNRELVLFKKDLK